MKKRVVGYDIIKSMAMFFVVMLHYSFYTRFYSSGLAGTAVTVLCVVCVPLFFAVNGALLLPRKMDEAKHYRKTLNIVIVVTIWRLLAAAFDQLGMQAVPALNLQNNPGREVSGSLGYNLRYWQWKSNIDTVHTAFRSGMAYQAWSIS